MFDVKNYEYECTRKCRLRHHGNSITAALTKRSISDEKLAAFIAKTCCNYFDVVDDLGRSAVHMSASVGRYMILEWLLNQSAIINGRDYESGSSPLHRSLYYGSIDCAVLLLRYGASLELLDLDTRCPLQSICRMGDLHNQTEHASSNDILVWGSNKNYNLGIGNDQSATTPQSVDFFRKTNIYVDSVALGAYHSLFLDKKSQLYSVGHGKGGRLGNGTENSLPAPKKVKVPIKQNGEVVICISASRKHSLLLTNRSVVYACGLNEDQQLGVRDADEKLTVFKEVITLRDHGVTDLLSVIAREQHSLTYSMKYIYVWGTNNGQFGINANTKTIKVPTMLKLPPRTVINFVESSSAATVIYTNDDQIILYFNDKMRTMKPPNYEGLKNISITGGDNKKSSKGTATALKLLMLTKTNVIFIWYENTQSFYRSNFAHYRISEIDKILYKSNQVMILSQGYVYQGKCHQVPLPSEFGNETNATAKKQDLWQNNDQNRTEISKEHMIRIDLQRLPNIDRAVNVYCDDEFTAFAVLQESHMKYFKMPTLTPATYSFKKLYHDVSEMDAVHDIVFHIDNESFPAHKLIIYARAAGLRETVSAFQDKHIYLNFDNLTSKMFEIMLKYIYTNCFPNDEDLDCIQQSLGPYSPKTLSKVCQMFYVYVEKFQLNDLASYLKSYLDTQYFPISDKMKYRFNRLRRNDFPALYDVRIICEAGIEIEAHKCILVDRLDYFEMMFTHTWAEHSTINLSSIPVEYMEPIVDFLYSGDIEHFRKQNYSETYLYKMVVYCDQFFIERLQKVCEILILDKISLRKCGEMFEFACLYNCQLLKNGCMDFICQNMARVLSYRSLEQCEPEALKCLNTHYRNMFRDVFAYRMITPDSEAIEDELLLSFVDDFQVDLEQCMDENTLRDKEAKRKQMKIQSEHDVRRYERDAITTMMKSISINDSNTTRRQSEKSQAVEDAQKISQQLQNESKSWLKVVNKNEQKRKQIDNVVKLNSSTLKMEDKTEFIQIPNVIAKSTTTCQTPEKNTAAQTFNTTAKLDESTSTPIKCYDFDLSNFTPQREKLSQKQRKRLSSESKSSSSAASSNWRSPVPNAQPIPVQPVPTPNAWGVLPQQSPSSLSLSESIYSPTATGNISDPSSFANMMRTAVNQTSPSSSLNNNNSNNSFAKILVDERRQREYYDRMRNKSLVLTQIEETAIAELREFYNVDNVFDEMITIERKSVPRTMNFSTWRKN